MIVIQELEWILLSIHSAKAFLKKFCVLNNSTAIHVKDVARLLKLLDLKRGVSLICPIKI